MIGTPAAKAGYRWLFVEGLGQEKAHQFLEPVEPDKEGVLTALCGREVMAFRTLDGYRLPACFDCLVAHGAGEADKLEDWTARVAASNRVTSK